MRSSRARGIVLVLAVVALAMGVVTSALAASETYTTRSKTAADGSLTIAFASLGNAGALHGNLNYWTSPVDRSGDFEWFNQDVQITDLALLDSGSGEPTLTSAAVRLKTGSGYGAWEAVPEPFTATQDGVYSVAASGTDFLLGEVAGEITPAFGIDTVGPVITTDRAPYYSSAANVTVTATDTMSGMESVLFSVDGDRNDSWEPDFLDPSTFAATFPFSGEGMHSVSWTGFDNAGNAVRGSVAFGIGHHTIKPSRSNTHGTISPSTTQTVLYGASKTFTMKAKHDYRILKVVVDRKSVGARSSYRFSNVKGNHTIRAYFVHK